MKNKRWGVIASIAAIVVLAGCSSTVATSSTASADKSKIKVAYVSLIQGISYYAAFDKGGQAEAKKLGIKFTGTGPAKADSAEQLRIFNSLVAQGYKGIAIAPVDPTALNSAIAAARAKGVTVITSDADATGSKRQLYVAQASGDALGAQVLDQIAEQMGGKGDYGIVSGAANTTSFNSWIAGAEAEQKKKYPDMHLVGGVQYTLTTADALSDAQNLITAHPDIKGILALPSSGIPGVAQAIENANLTGKIAMCGFGSPQTALPYVKAGVMKSTVLWDVPQLGALTVWAMNQLITGKGIKASNTIPGFKDPVVYDKANQTLILGKPIVFTKANINNYDY
ncbi:MAG TPA: autoinducer 2 ABC transporter substrate-binding protein [Thermomicrobiales bacterium]|nr:autoinducer 2 ABC transporter substrate-binding protein [Thermomicrobiales bacterium]